MYESGNLGFLLEDDCNSHLTTLNKSSCNQYKHSLERCSNRISHILYKDVWQKNDKLLSDKAVNCILGSTNKLLSNCDTSNTKTWRSSLSKFTDPEVLFNQSVPPCSQCTTAVRESSPSAFLDNECKCNLGMTKSQKHPTKDKIKASFVKNINFDSSQDSKSGEEQRLQFKPKFGRPRHAAKSQSSTKLNIQENSATKLWSYQDSPVAKPVTVQEMDLDKEEEENRAHKSNVAKITFKTAKETLLASNPAAKRTLGASRKASSKFVSPMIGAQEKQESQEPTYTDESLKHIDPKMIELIESEIIDKGAPIGWEDIAGLQLAKATIQEAVVWPLLRPDLFTGLRRPPKGILLFGPPGTGKTLIGKCVAAQCHATFFSISASSLTSKWIGDGEKMVRALFAVARRRQPAVIFIDEIDSLLTQRSDSEHEATRRIKTEFLVQFDGAATGEEERLLVVGATNRPHELDEAARRRLVKRLYVPLPDAHARQQIITNLLKNESNELTEEEISEVASLTEGYSGADMRSLCAEAAMGPVRALPPPAMAAVSRDQVRPVNLQDFKNALQRVRPSVSQDDLGVYVKWNNTYGQGF